ncbi:MAG: ribosome biogenesis GTPase Der [Alphaproteobacteria bacterium]
MTFTVAIIGRPNVGKSTLFNRLAGRRAALVDDTPGVTRDRRTGPGRLGTLRFTVVDTAGLDDATDDSMEARMRRQTERALADADVALMLVDARAGVTPLDRHFARALRRGPTPVVLVANKCDGRAAEPGLLEAYELGLGEPVGISAEHALGLGELAEALEPFAGTPAGDGAAPDAASQADLDDELETAAGRPIQLAIVGRPNVGKSTLVNALLGDDRVLTGPEPGMTRDAIAVDWTYRDRTIRLVDTAGLRRRARVADRLERIAVTDTLKTVRLAQIVVLLLDSAAILDKQDLTIARHVVEEGRALVIAVNKWDLVTDHRGALRRLRDRLETSLPQVRGIPTVTVSALKHQRLDALLDAVLAIYETWNSRVATGPLNRWLDGMVTAHPPPMAKGRRLKLRYLTQVKGRPPTFALWASIPDAVPESYVRYLVNGLRETFDLSGVPIRILLRKGKNPYASA